MKKQLLHVAAAAVIGLSASAASAGSVNTASNYENAFKTYFENTATSMSWTNAYLLMHLSKLVYLYSLSNAETVLKDYGFTNTKIVVKSNRAAMFAANDDIVVAVFAGVSDPWKPGDFWSLVKAWRGATDSLWTGWKSSTYNGKEAKYYQGARDSAEAFYDGGLKSFLSSYGKKSSGTGAQKAIWLAGHSFGGATAVAMAGLLQKKKENVQGVHTYGALRGANGAFNKWLTVPVYAIVNEDDHAPYHPAGANLTGQLYRCTNGSSCGSIKSLPDMKACPADFNKKILGIKIKVKCNPIWEHAGAHDVSRYQKHLYNVVKDKKLGVATVGKL